MAQKRRDNPKRNIKLSFSEEEHDLVRIAAAFNRQTMVDFCRDIVMRETARLTKDLQIPPKGRRESK